MKLLLFIPILLVLIVTPAFGALSDATGLINRLDVDAGGYTLEVKVVANFDVIDHEFDKDEKRLTIFIVSSLENNLGEIIIPKILLDGNFTFYLNDVQLNPIIKSNDRISFITLNFTGVGNNKIDIIATKTIAGIEEKTETFVLDESASEGGGCLIATATYGTELAPQVQQLREIRDQKLMNTEFGQSFLNSFNDFYYSFSPYIADYERENLVFKEIVKIIITPMISSLSILNYVDMDSEVQVLGYGISLILLNLGMYVGIPAVVIVGIRKKF
ncbi:MAG: peptidylprolyl isomerase [Thaumarchaeota archaeon]|nr:peptidylprolyl isomerase [Nitrososphaerota archaeon]